MVPSLGFDSTQMLDVETIRKVSTLYNWIDTFVIKPNEKLGRTGIVCPFCPISVDQNRMYFQILRGEKSLEEIKPVLLQYRDLFLNEGQKPGKDAIYQTFIMIFPDVSEKNYDALIDGVQRELKVYFVEKGLMLGGMHPLVESGGIHNPEFRPLKSPTPILVIRYMTKLDIQFLNTPKYPTDLRIKFLKAYLLSFESKSVQKALDDLVRENSLTNTLCNKASRNHIARGRSTSYSTQLRSSLNMYQMEEVEKITWTVIFGSQTGTAEYFANRLVNALTKIASSQNNITVRLSSIDEYNFQSELEKEKYLFVLASTFGNGDPPTTAVSFDKFLMSSENLALSCNYAVFGLGSRHYPNFCQFATRLDERLNEIGGKRIIELHKGDELSDQRIQYEIWSKKIITELYQNISHDTSLTTLFSTSSNNWRLEEHGLGQSRLSRFSYRVNPRFIQEKLIDIYLLSKGMPISGVENLLQSTIYLIGNYISTKSNNQSEPADTSFPQKFELNEKNFKQAVMQASRVKQSQTRTFDLLKIFDLFDKDGDGFISKKEFIFAIKQIGVNFTEKELEQLLFKIDKNRDGFISYADFIAFMKNDDELIHKIITSRVKPISRLNPLFAIVLENKNLFTSKSTRSTRLVRFDIKDRGGGTIFYRPGDHLGIFPENNPQIIHEAISLLNIGNADIMFELKINNKLLVDCISSPLPSGITYWQALSSYIDLQKPPSQYMCEIFSSYCTDPSQKEKLSKFGDIHSPDYNQWLLKQSPTILTFLKEFSSIDLPDLSLFFEHAPTMQPRLYSICSSLNYSSEEVAITVAQLTYQTNNEDIRNGTCSSWLQYSVPSSLVDRSFSIPIFATSSNFHLPDDERIPIIMIATGTGIAPFRSFWQERCYQKESFVRNFGDFILYYGCRNENEHLFSQEMSDMLATNVFSTLKIAYSRAGQRRRVTDDLKEDAKELFELCRTNAYIYICGDITISESITQSLRDSWSNLDSSDPLWDRMESEGRIRKDIFGSFINIENSKKMDSPFEIKKI